ncbi:putative mitochondrial protein [Cucumis melo var. makuwa]|uniref:Putative mitochondrial protein n=1 Tax=Cucumis melo var. makuwa TaxID=1194695 RepID=A0A5D3D2H6_CUCMM|nr:putative mitochondrial protein [Cucumis melo var. makuwa]
MDLPPGFMVDLEINTISLSSKFKAFTTSLDAAIIPKNTYEAMESPKWKAVVVEEMGALEENKTWDNEDGDKHEIKDLENLKYFLRMEVAQSRKGILVSQRKYTLDLLKETETIGCRQTNTPMEFNVKLGNYVDKVPADKEKETSKRCIEVYTDSDWARSMANRKYSSGYCTFVWGNIDNELPMKLVITKLLAA